MEVALAVALLAPRLALAHPGSGIVVDRQGHVYFVDTGQGVFRIGADGKLVPRPGSAYHWMTIDVGDRFGGARFPSIPSGEIRSAGSSPTLILASDFPVVMGPDGGLYYPLLNTRSRLQILRLTPSGQTSVFANLPVTSPDGRPLRWLNGIAAGADNTIYFTVSAAVMKVGPDGSISTVANISLAECGPIPGTDDEPKPYLRGIDVDAHGVLYVAASGCGSLLEVRPDGGVTPRLRAQSPWSPTGVAVSGTDLYVLEYLHTPGEDRREWLPRVRKLSSDGKIVTVATIERR